jgi:beta-lactamase regulating signal transducer with metallopeptidase domain
MTALDQAAVPLLGALGAAALKATLLIATGAGTVAVIGRRSAALKHAIWTMTLGATMAVLLLPLVIPGWRVVPIPAASLGDALPSAKAHATSDAVVVALEPRYEAVEPVDIGHVPFSSPPTSARSAGSAWPLSDHWPSLLAAVWLAGAIGVLARHLLGVLSLRRLCRSARTLGDSAGATLGRRLAEDLHIGRPVTFLTSDDIEVPLTWGMFHPRVVLPSHAGDWREDRLQHVLQHELAHVKRLDAGTQFVASAACAAFWFHPLVWEATRQMRHERERACDDRVVTQGVVPSAYAADLLALVDAYGPTDRHYAALAMARRSTLEGRVLALLDTTIDHGVARREDLAVSLLLAVLFVVPAAAVRAAPMNPMTFALPGAPSPAPMPAIGEAPQVSTSGSAAITAPRRAVAAVPVADLFEGCLTRGSHLDDSQDPVDGRRLWTASFRGADCDGQLTAHGDITFNREVSAIERISTDGDIDVTTRIHGDTTRLVARAAGAGAITYALVRNGQPAEFDGEGRAWLASFLTTLDRHTAFAVNQRLPLLSEAGGASGVLDEIDRLRTDHAREVYVGALAARAPLAEPELDRAIAIVARLTSEHARLSGLLALASHDRLEGARLDAYLTAAATIQSAAGHRRAMAAVNHR